MQRHQKQSSRVCAQVGANDETGQALVQVAIMLVVLLGFVALAIDVGMIYAERRHMQNAADAGALAGARELCISGNKTQAEARAQEYTVTQNGATSADIDVRGNVVDVVAHISADTFLAGILGIADVAIQADAAAACGGATSACGLWPVAFSRSAWERFYDPGDGTCTPRRIVIWSGDNDNQAPPSCGPKWPKNEKCVCKDKDTGKPTDDLCRCYKCVDNAGEYSLVSSEGRAWLDFSNVALPVLNPEPFGEFCPKKGCGESELECYIRNKSATRIRVDSCIDGANGVKAGVADGVDSRIGQFVSIPLYDYTGCAGNSCPGQTYHVSKFGCIKVGGWVQKFPEIFPYDPSLYETIKNAKMIVGYVNCTNACMSSCGTTDGTPAEPWEVKAVSLIK